VEIRKFSTHHRRVDRYFWDRKTSGFPRHSGVYRAVFHKRERPALHLLVPEDVAGLPGSAEEYALAERQIQPESGDKVRAPPGTYPFGLKSNSASRL
jgi:hypothetical protein